MRPLQWHWENNGHAKPTRQGDLDPHYVVSRLQQHVTTNKPTPTRPSVGHCYERPQRGLGLVGTISGQQQIVAADVGVAHKRSQTEGCLMFMALKRFQLDC